MDIFVNQVRRLTSDQSSQLASEYLKKTDFFSITSARITDKMPHNFMLAGLISLLFPNCRIIYCRRGAVDNCFSIYSNMLNDAHSYGTDLSVLGWYYRQQDELMKHWQASLGNRITEVQYEELVEDLEGVSRRLVDFIGLPWDPACLDFFANDRTVTTISRWQVRQPIYKTSIARWKPFEKYLGPLFDALGDLATQ
jgi:hypothetical protein